jgi:hypothetical protein
MKNGTTKTFKQVVRKLKNDQSEGWAGEKDGEVHEVLLTKSVVHMDASSYGLVYIKHKPKEVKKP